MCITTNQQRINLLENISSKTVQKHCGLKVSAEFNGRKKYRAFYGVNMIKCLFPQGRFCSVTRWKWENLLGIAFSTVGENIRELRGVTCLIYARDTNHARYCMKRARQSPSRELRSK